MKLTITLSTGETQEIDELSFPLVLEWNGKEYRIIKTKNGKLIMN